MVEVYNKAIRDKIPEIIGKTGRISNVITLPDAEFLTELEKKLMEELTEYMASKSVEELADIIEVIYRICRLKGATLEELEQIRLSKKESRGGFEKNLYLIQVE